MEYHFASVLGGDRYTPVCEMIYHQTATGIWNEKEWIWRKEGKNNRKNEGERDTPPVVN